MTREKRLTELVRQDGLSPEAVKLFGKIIYDNYRRMNRTAPWRKTKNPYRIFVSEVMLQQTQVERVLDKYREFIRTFPGFPSLAAAPLSAVLRIWQGLGYNRRALCLKKSAVLVMNYYSGKLPADPEELITFPGIGDYSAKAICTFVHNRPSLFIETNIRRVFIHFFFRDREGVRDAEIYPILEKTLDRKNPREWYYALMDYGVKLKREVRNPNRRSAHYQKQTRFEGSSRQVRGMILKNLLKTQGLTKAELTKKFPKAPENFPEILEGMVREGFVKKFKGRFVVP
jgi:A/G-specific adenine glycosylase